MWQDEELVCTTMQTLIFILLQAQLHIIVLACITLGALRKNCARTQYANAHHESQHALCQRIACKTRSTISISGPIGPGVSHGAELLTSIQKGGDGHEANDGHHGRQRQCQCARQVAQASHKPDDAKDTHESERAASYQAPTALARKDGCHGSKG